MFPIKPVNIEVKCQDLLFSSIFVKLHKLVREVFRKCCGHSLENGTFRKFKMVRFEDT